MPRGTAAWSSRWTLRLQLPVVLVLHQVPEGSPCGGDGGGDGVDPFRGAGGALAFGGLARAALLQSQKNTWNRNGHRQLGSNSLK